MNIYKNDSKLFNIVNTIVIHYNN